MMARVTAGVAAIVAPIALVLALVHSHHGWRAERSAHVDLIELFDRVRQQRSFPSDGEELLASNLRVMRSADTVLLGELVRGRSAVIYFQRPDCPICVDFAAIMDSTLPAWRDSLVVIDIYRRDLVKTSVHMLDSASSKFVTGVPALLVVDSSGVVRHSVEAGLPMVLRVLGFVGFPAPFEMLTLRSEEDRLGGSRGGDTSAVAVREGVQRGA